MILDHLGLSWSYFLLTTAMIVVLEWLALHVWMTMNWKTY
jgi:hypothetical protein